MIIASILENLKTEKRVSITPDIVSKYKDLGFEIILQEGYGEHLGFSKQKYLDKGDNGYIYDCMWRGLNIVVKTIIKYCKDSFHICLIDDSSFKRLLPDWKYPMNRISSPLTDHVRKYAIMEILYRYGGMTVPPSFVC